MSPGQMVSLFYVTLYLLVPMISNLLFGQAYWSIYHYNSPPFWAIGLLFGLWLFCASPMMHYRFPQSTRPSRQIYLIGQILRRHLLKITIVLALGILALYSPQSADFRYADAGLSAGGLTLIVVLVLKSMATIGLMWLLVIYVRQGMWLNRSDRIAVWILAGLMFYTIAGTADFLTAIFFLIFAVMPRTFANLVFMETGRSLVSTKAILHLLSPFLALGLFFVALMVGDSIKSTGSIGLETRFIEFSVSFFFIRVVDGIGSHYYAFMQFFDPRVYQLLQHYDYPMLYPLAAVEYRMGQLFGLSDMIRPEIQSLSRLNFLVNSYKISATEGTSPGLFASFFFVLPIALAVPAALLYLRWVISVVDRFFDLPGYKLSLFGAFFILLQLLFFYQSPPDFLILFDNAVISVAAMWLFARINQDAQARAAQSAPAGQAPPLPALS